MAETLLPTTGLSIGMVAQTLGHGSNDLGTLCTSDRINICSKYKPTNYPGVNPTGTWYKGYDNNCGVTFTVYDSPSTMDNAVAHNWIYNKPSGGSSSPYRLGDFREYKHDATPCLCSGQTTDLSVNLLTDATFTIGQPLANLQAHDLLPSDFSGTVGSSILGNFYFTVLITETDGTTTGMCLSSNNGVRPLSTAATYIKIKDGGNTVTFTSSDFDAAVFLGGPCKCQVALGYAPMKTMLDNNTWVPAFKSAQWLNPFNITFIKEMPFTFTIANIGNTTTTTSGAEWTPAQYTDPYDPNQYYTGPFHTNSVQSMEIDIMNVSDKDLVLDLDALQISYLGFNNSAAGYTRTQIDKNPAFTNSAKTIIHSIAINKNSQVQVFILNNAMTFNGTAPTNVSQAGTPVGNDGIIPMNFTFSYTANNVTVTSPPSPTYNFIYDISITP